MSGDGEGLVVAEDYERQRREIEEGLSALEAAFENTVPQGIHGRFRGHRKLGHATPLLGPLAQAIAGYRVLHNLSRNAKL